MGLFTINKVKEKNEDSFVFCYNSKTSPSVPGVVFQIVILPDRLTDGLCCTAYCALSDNDGAILHHQSQSYGP